MDAIGRILDLVARALAAIAAAAGARATTNVRRGLTLPRR